MSSKTSNLKFLKPKFVFAYFLFLVFVVFGTLTYSSSFLNFWYTNVWYQDKGNQIPASTTYATVTLRRRYSNYDLRNMGPAESNGELELLLNIRKLIIYSVHELNKPLNLTGCVKWWANPLDLISYEQLSKNRTHSKLEIKFKVQPGSIPFKLIISQKLPPIEITDNELEIVDMEPLDKIPFTKCNGPNNKYLSNPVQKTCLCSTAKETKDLENQTAKLRVKWSLMDKELVTWPPESSFSVLDYINFTDYQSFVISPAKKEVAQKGYSTEYCGTDVKLLVMISSAPSNGKKRKIIRQTFANPVYLKGKGVKVVFMMGIPKNETLKKEVVKEAGQSNDIIQANFVDSYHNLTLSHLSMYKWIYLTCAQETSKEISMPQHILKADDDFLLNIELALKVAQNNPDVELIGCHFCGNKAVRNVNYMSQHYIPRYIYISGSYPGYLSGGAYLLRTDVIPRILHMSITTPLIHMDDVYVTGFLPRQLKIYPRLSSLFTYGRTEPNSCLTKKIVCSYVLEPNDMTLQWNKFVEPAPLNCSFKDLPLKVNELDECFFE